MVHANGLSVKKKFGQHFLRDHAITDAMLSEISLTNASVVEIGCGDGFLTKAILAHPIQQLVVFEIDPEWADYVRTTIKDSRLTVYTIDVLQVDFTILAAHAPWILLANLPYQVAFPILHRIQQYRHLFKEGVVMIQEEVAQKIVKTSGRGYGYPSLFFQHYFTFTLLRSVPPTAFFPPPKVVSRLLYFKPRIIVDPIPDEKGFWPFIRFCFQQPRRMLKNNLAATHYDVHAIPAAYDGLRAQQLSMADLCIIWDLLRHDKGSKNL